jgi:hypothetical protein
MLTETLIGSHAQLRNKQRRTSRQGPFADSFSAANGFLYVERHRLRSSHADSTRNQSKTSSVAGTRLCALREWTYRTSSLRTRPRSDSNRRKSPGVVLGSIEGDHPGTPAGPAKEVQATRFDSTGRGLEAPRGFVARSTASCRNLCSPER